MVLEVRAIQWESAITIREMGREIFGGTLEHRIRRAKMYGPIVKFDSNLIVYFEVYKEIYEYF